MNSILFISVGNKEYLHRQTNFAILSMLARAKGGTGISFYVATDHPEWYSWIGRHVEIVQIDELRLRDWKGPHDFFYRIKIRAMQHVHAAQPDANLIYVDCDVVCRDDLAPVFDALDQGQCFMHTKEHPMGGGKQGTAAQLWTETQYRTFGPLTVDDDSAMWNSGVVAIPSYRCRQYLDDALACNDAMCEAGVNRKVLEQFAISLSLSRDPGLRGAEPWFLHYWGNKAQWSGLIAKFMSEVMMKELSIEAACDRLTELDLDMPTAIKRNRLERFAHSVSKRLRRRDHRVEEALTSMLSE